MRLWKTKPEVVEAEQFTGSLASAGGLVDAFKPFARVTSWGHRDENGDWEFDLKMRVAGGEVTVRPGDWIVRGASGAMSVDSQPHFESVYVEVRLPARSTRYCPEEEGDG